MASKVKVFLTSIAFMLLSAHVHCGGDKGHSHDYIKIDIPHHTIHHKHIQKVPDVQIVKVPVIKEVKILEPYKVPYKVKVPYIIKQEVHVHKEEHHEKPVHTSEHVYHKKTHSKPQSHDFGKSYFSHAASNMAPMIVSHTPVEDNFNKLSYLSSHHSLPQGFEVMSARDFQPYDYTARLHTSVPKVGFGSSEGQIMNSYEVNEAPEGPLMFSGRSLKLSHHNPSEGLAGAAYPYPIQQADDSDNIEYMFGFDPIASSYDFTK